MLFISYKIGIESSIVGVFLSVCSGNMGRSFTAKSFAKPQKRSAPRFSILPFGIFRELNNIIKRFKRSVRQKWLQQSLFYLEAHEYELKTRTSRNVSLGTLRHVLIVCCIGLFLAQVARSCIAWYNSRSKKKRKNNSSNPDSRWTVATFSWVKKGCGGRELLTEPTKLEKDDMK